LDLRSHGSALPTPGRPLAAPQIRHCLGLGMVTVVVVVAIAIAAESQPTTGVDCISTASFRLMVCLTPL
jgi:hypothetical protein